MEHNYYRVLSAETAGESVPEWLKKQKRSVHRREKKSDKDKKKKKKKDKNACKHLYGIHKLERFDDG